MSAAHLALLALVPALLGPLPAPDRALTIALCSGGEIRIPLGEGEGERDSEERGDCHQQGCHAGTCRQKGKRGLDLTGH